MHCPVDHPDINRRFTQPLPIRLERDRLAVMGDPDRVEMTGDGFLVAEDAAVVDVRGLEQDLPEWFWPHDQDTRPVSFRMGKDVHSAAAIPAETGLEGEERTVDRLPVGLDRAGPGVRFEERLHEPVWVENKGRHAQ